jgi:quercetin dioxygenase-like cupin family protein
MTGIDPHPPAALLGFNPAAFGWAGIDEQSYKVGAGDERGMGWKGVTRHTLVRAPSLPAAFETRFFELEPGGYSSLEKHRHVHFVIGLRGSGWALVGDQVHEISLFDALYVPPFEPHRWLNASSIEEPFGFLCTVDADRDRPRPLDDEEWERLRSNPLTAPYVF